MDQISPVDSYKKRVLLQEFLWGNYTKEEQNSSLVFGMFLMLTHA